VKPIIATLFSWLREGNVDQPRDDHGRWTGGDSASSLVTRDTVKDGGASYSIYGGQPASGYMVAHISPTASIPETTDVPTVRKAVNAFVKANAAMLRLPNNFIGAWHDHDRGIIDLDVSHNIDNRHDTFAMADKHNQISVYDVVNKDVINTMSDGKRPRESGGKLNESVKPSKNGTKLFFKPDTPVDEIAQAIVDQVKAHKNS
jgi:hypothetical protein